MPDTLPGLPVDLGAPPGVKPKRFKLKRYTPKEAEILRAIKDYLAWKRMIFARTNSGCVMVAGRGGRNYPVQLCPEGWPDITCNWRGIALAIECKRPGEKLNPEQINARDAWEKEGGVWITATSVDDVRKVVEGRG